jgi:hypothetical protein
MEEHFYKDEEEGRKDTVVCGEDVWWRRIIY